MRLSSTLFAASLALSVGLGSLGCHHGGEDREVESPAEAVAALNDPSWEVRRHAADKLRDDGGPSPQAIPALWAAIQREREPHAYGAMLITLGASGIPEVRPLIDARVNAADEDMQRWARRALKYWLVANGLLAKDADLPEPPNPLYGPPPPLPPTAPGSHPGLVNAAMPMPGAPAPGMPAPGTTEPGVPMPNTAPAPGTAPPGPGAGPNGSI